MLLDLLNSLLPLVSGFLDLEEPPPKKSSGLTGFSLAFLSSSALALASPLALAFESPLSLLRFLGDSLRDFLFCGVDSTKSESESELSMTLGRFFLPAALLSGDDEVDESSSF